MSLISWSLLCLTDCFCSLCVGPILSQTPSLSSPARRMLWAFAKRMVISSFINQSINNLYTGLFVQFKDWNALGWRFQVYENAPRRTQRRTYAANFSWSKRTRVNTKWFDYWVMQFWLILTCETDTFGCYHNKIFYDLTLCLRPFHIFALNNFNNQNLI